MELQLSKAEHDAQKAMAKHGAARIRASSDHLQTYERLVSAGLAYSTAFDESARFYGLTGAGQERAGM